jgi:hypothetical protein
MEPSDVVVRELESGHERVVQAMLRAAGPLPLPEADRRQFVVGFLNLIESAAAGDLAPRDEYLHTVIPGVKASGMTLPFVVSNLCAVMFGLASAASDATLDWYAAFGRDYAARMVTAWETA